MENKQKIIDEIKAYLFFGFIGLILILFFIKPVVTNVIEEYKRDAETITNKEMQEFKEWEEKQSKIEWENSKVSK